MFHRNRNRGDGILLFIREHITCTKITFVKIKIASSETYFFSPPKIDEKTTNILVYNFSIQICTLKYLPKNLHKDNWMYFS